jgi:hypothetical protein
VRGNGEGRPIISLDIDGTLADYHGWFLNFASLYLGESMPSPTRINPGMPLHRFMGITKASYREVKLAYRQGGMKRSMPCLEGASEAIAKIRKKAEVWICTTRPYLRLDNIDPDTREFLRRNGIGYDALLFDPADIGTRGGKYRELKRQAGPRVAACAEDLPEEAMRALGEGFAPILLRNRPYNITAWEFGDANDLGVGMTREPGEPYGIHRWDTAEELLNFSITAIEGWHRK